MIAETVHHSSTYIILYMIWSTECAASWTDPNKLFEYHGILLALIGDFLWYGVISEKSFQSNWLP